MGQSPKLLDRVREAVRVRHYSRRTETAYVFWVRRYILYHRRVHPARMGAEEIERFLTWLAVERRVSASTQNQALSALLFLYREVLRVELGPVAAIPRARVPNHVPVVLAVAEVRAVMAQLTGVPWLVVALLYGAGLRLQECLELRVKDIDFERREIVVRRGKGQKDRRTMFPDVAGERLRLHLEAVRRQHDEDIAAGYGRVVLPAALDRSTRMRRPTGGGGSCFRPGVSAAIRDGVRPRDSTCTRRRFSGRLPSLRGGPGWPSG